jgi:uncharacterized protein YjbI with pentapeptide repeats
VIGKAAAPAIALLLLLGHGRLESPTTALAIVPGLEAPPEFKGGSPTPPAVLPPAHACSGSAADPGNHRLPGQIDGTLVKGAQGLRALRAAWADSLIFVRGGKFDGADLRGAGLHNICFVGTSFVASDWRGADARGVGFFWSHLTGSNLAGARMAGVLFDNPYLARVDATGANFSGGSVSGSDFGSLAGLRMDGANLRGFRFDCRPISGEGCGEWDSISFRNADLRGALLDGVRGQADWRGARIGGTRVRLTQLKELAPARVTGSVIVHEAPVKVALAPKEYRWLQPRIGDREEALPADSDRRRVTARPKWMRKGADVLFVAPTIGFDDAARASPLYKRLMPAIVAGAISYARVKVKRDGSVEASGSAIGGNGHMCGLGAKGLRLGKDGWYSAWAEPFDPPNPPPTAPVPVLRFWNDRVEVFEGGRPRDEAVLRNGFDRFAMCGARAEFDEMMLVPFPPSEAHRLWHAAGMDAG